MHTNRVGFCLYNSLLLLSFCAVPSGLAQVAPLPDRQNLTGIAGCAGRAVLGSGSWVPSGFSGEGNNTSRTAKPGTPTAKGFRS
ncbi:MAG TPA: hypothetical protein VJ864_14205 [Candidatus Binatia bacterium]|jgi:hypothetical protein|nr:hypothetical protein [Candidatus Binatia bacterium]